MVSVLLAYATYQRCVLYSPLLSGVYWLLTGTLAVYVVYAAITSKSHLLLEDRSPALNSKPSTQDHMSRAKGCRSRPALALLLPIARQFSGSANVHTWFDENGAERDVTQGDVSEQG
eukprot:s8070_g3.t1